MSDEDILTRFLAGDMPWMIALTMAREQTADSGTDGGHYMHVLAVIRARLAALTAYKAGHKRAGRKRIWADQRARNKAKVDRYRARKKAAHQPIPS